MWSFRDLHCFAKEPFKSNGHERQHIIHLLRIHSIFQKLAKLRCFLLLILTLNMQIFGSHIIPLDLKYAQTKARVTRGGAWQKRWSFEKNYHKRTFYSTIIQFKQKNPAPQRGSVVKDFACDSWGHRFESRSSLSAGNFWSVRGERGRPPIATAATDSCTWPIFANCIEL
jgi:hypothetical protein